MNCVRRPHTPIRRLRPAGRRRRPSSSRHHRLLEERARRLGVRMVRRWPPGTRPRTGRSSPRSPTAAPSSRALGTTPERLAEQADRRVPRRGTRVRCSVRAPSAEPADPQRERRPSGAYCHRCGELRRRAVLMISARVARNDGFQESSFQRCRFRKASILAAGPPTAGSAARIPARGPQRRGRLNTEFVEEPPGVVSVRSVSFRRPVRYSASVRRAHSRSAPAAKPPKGRQRLDLTRPLS